MICPQCGAQNLDNYKFCSVCGARLTGHSKAENQSGFDFEREVLSVIEGMGFAAELTTRTADGGIDIVARSEQPLFKGKYIIQCKKWTKPVGEPVIRDLFGVMTAERANKGILITTSRFTAAAIEFAKDKPLELIAGEAWAQLAEMARLKGRLCKQCDFLNSSNARFCVNCGAQLLRACPACGYENPVEARFCGACGKNYAEILSSLRDAIKVAKATNVPLGQHILFIGTPNSTQCAAQRLAKELSVGFKKVDAVNIQPGELAALFTGLRKGDILYLDSVHHLPRGSLETLCSVMGEYVLDIAIRKGARAREVQLKLPQFTIIGGTIEPNLVDPTLRSRFNFCIQLQGVKRLLQIATQRPEDIEVEFAAAWHTLDVPLALEQLDNVITTNPSFKEAYYLKGLIREKQGRLAEAVRSWQQAYKVDSSYKNVRVALEKFITTNLKHLPTPHPPPVPRLRFSSTAIAVFALVTAAIGGLMTVAFMLSLQRHIVLPKVEPSALGASIVLVLAYPLFRLFQSFNVKSYNRRLEAFYEKVKELKSQQEQFQSLDLIEQSDRILMELRKKQEKEDLERERKLQAARKQRRKIEEWGQKGTQKYPAAVPQGPSGVKWAWIAVACVVILFFLCICCVLFGQGS